MHRLLRILVPAGVVVSVTIVSPVPAAAQRSGVDIWSQSCGRCHRPQPPIRYSADAWETIVAQMRIYARLTDDEANAVLQFLQGAARRVAENDAGSDSMVVAERGTEPISVAADGAEVRAADLPAQRDSVVRYVRTRPLHRHP